MTAAGAYAFFTTTLDIIYHLFFTLNIHFFFVMRNYKKQQSATIMHYRFIFLKASLPGKITPSDWFKKPLEVSFFMKYYLRDWARNRNKVNRQPSDLGSDALPLRHIFSTILYNHINKVHCILTLNACDPHLPRVPRCLSVVSNRSVGP